MLWLVLKASAIIFSLFFLSKKGFRQLSNMYWKTMCINDITDGIDNFKTTKNKTENLHCHMSCDDQLQQIWTKQNGLYI